MVVEVTPAVRRTIATTASLDGQIAPMLNSTLSSPQSGNVIAVYVNEGDRVRQGELLAKIDDSTLRAQLVQAEGQIAAARGKLQGSTITQPIEATQYDTTYRQAQERLHADEAALRNAEIVYNSNTNLYPRGYVALTALEQSRAAYVSAQQQVRQDQAALASARAGLGQRQADLQTVASNRGDLQQAIGTAQQLRAEIAQTNVVAPFDGVVTARQLDPGAFAGPNQAVVTVSRLDPVYIYLNVPDDVLSYAHPGASVTFTTNSFPGRSFTGTISEVNAVPTQGTLSYRARIVYPNPDNRLRGGMFVQVTLLKERRANVVTVPPSAIVQGPQGPAVFAAQNGHAVRVPVRVGLRTDLLAEVQGVPAGERIITTRQEMLQDGAPIVVADGKAAQ